VPRARKDLLAFRHAVRRDVQKHSEALGIGEKIGKAMSHQRGMKLASSRRAELRFQQAITFLIAQWLES